MIGKHRITVSGLLAVAALLGCSEEGAREMVVDPQSAPGTSLGVNLDQCANAPRTDPCTWQNGNLNGNNSAYAEGLVVPFRLAIQGLAAGAHSININYDFTAGGHKAYDFLATHDATEIVNICAPGGGGRSSLCGASNTIMPGGVTSQVVAFGGDAFSVDGNDVDGAIADGGVPTNLTIYNGTITSIDTVTHSGPTDGNSTGNVVVTFTSTGGDVAFAWGGHLAKSSYWNGPGDPDGAGEVSGSPWHMRTQNLTVNDVMQGAKNQDRSIQPSAIIEDPTIAISKEVVTDSISAGDTLKFKINVWNEGPGDALNVTLEDTLPDSGLTWFEVADPEGACVIGTGAASEEILACSFGTLIPDDTVMITVGAVTSADDCGQVPNLAHATAGGEISADDTVTAGDTATVLCPNIMIDKQALTDTVSAGDTIQFKVIVWNPGPGDADSVMVTDTLPDSGLSWFEISDPDAACSIGTGDILTCDFGTMMANDSAEVTVGAETAAADCGTVTNTGHVTAANDTTRSDTDSLVVQCPSVMIDKQALTDTVSAGDTIQFKVIVWNPGPGDADSVMVTDTLPDSGLSWFEISDPDAACSIGTGDILTCDFGTMIANDSAEVTVGAESAAADCGTVTNTGHVTAANDTTRSDTDSLVVQCPNLMIEKEALTDTVTAGDSIRFKINVWNPGPGTATNVMLTDTLPNGGLTWIDNSSDCSITSGILTCDFGDLPPVESPGDTAMVTIAALTDAADCGTVTNRAWADGDNGDPVSDADSLVVQCPNLMIEKEALTDTVTAGDSIRFKINVWNPGPGTATNVMLTDTLPNGGLTWTENSSVCSITSGILTCDFGDLSPVDSPGDTAMVTIAALTDAADCGTVANRAWADGDNGDPVNDADSLVVQCPDLMIEKEALTDTVSAGDSIQFKIVVWNAGPGDADSVTLADTLPDSGLTWFEVSDPDNACGIASGILTCDFGTMMAGDSSEVTVGAETAAADCGTVTNTGHASAANDTTESDTDSLLVQCPDLSIEKVALVDTVAIGDTAVFTITVSNDGPGDAYDVMLKDTLPNSGLTWSIHSETPDLSACSIGTIAGPLQELTCDIGTLKADSSFAVVVKTDTIPSDYLLPEGGGTPVAAIEIDGNLFDNGGTPGIDWHDVGIVCATNTGCRIDLPTGSSDNAFGMGTKEDSPVPSVVFGSIPNNKSDLLRFYVTSRKQMVGDSIHDFLYVAWERVQAPNGTTNMDFEFNQDTSLSANGVTPVRTAFDILVKYDLAKGGTSPTLGYHLWRTAATAGGMSAAELCEASNSFPCWGKVQALNPPAVAAAINTGSVVDSIAPDAPRTLDPLTFGEAGIDLQAAGIFQAGVCRNFGSAYLKSRSSDSFNSEIKDFIAPVPINVSNCQPRNIPNTAWAQASNYAPPPSGAAGDWISDGDTITVTENGVAFLFSAPTLRLAEARASDQTFGSVASPAEASADQRVLLPRSDRQIGAPWPVSGRRYGVVSSQVTDAQRTRRMT